MGSYCPMGRSTGTVPAWGVWRMGRVGSSSRRPSPASIIGTWVGEGRGDIVGIGEEINGRGFLLPFRYVGWRGERGREGDSCDWRRRLMEGGKKWTILGRNCQEWC